jgi:hypothetical protein
MITANLYLDRITQRCKANQFHGSADEQAHFENASAMLGRDFDLRDGGRAACLKRGQRLSVRSHGLALAAAGGNRFYKNSLSYLCADAQARITYLANQVRLAAYQLDLLLLAKPEFTKTMRNLGRSRNLLNANGGAGDDAAERAKEGLPGAPIFT